MTCASDIANQNSASQVASFSISGTGRANLMRMGSESGTADAPTVNLGSYDGVAHRRIASTTATTGSVIAKTDVISLARDGSNGGMQLVYSSISAAASAECSLIAGSGTASGVVKEIASGDSGPTTLFNNGANIVFAHCLIGTTGHTTEVTLHRLGTGTGTWTGFVTSTLSQ